MNKLLKFAASNKLKNTYNNGKKSFSIAIDIREAG